MKCNRGSLSPHYVNLIAKVRQLAVRVSIHSPCCRERSILRASMALLCQPQPRNLALSPARLETLPCTPASRFVPQTFDIHISFQTKLPISSCKAHHSSEHCHLILINHSFHLACGFSAGFPSILGSHAATRLLPSAPIPFERTFLAASSATATPAATRSAPSSS